MRQKDEVIRHIRLIIDQGPKYDWLASSTEKIIKACLRRGLGVHDQWEQTEMYLYERQTALKKEDLQETEIAEHQAKIEGLRLDRKKISKKVNRQFKRFMRDIFGKPASTPDERIPQMADPSPGFHLDPDAELWTPDDVEPLTSDDTTAETLLDTDSGSHASLGASIQNAGSVDYSSGTDDGSEPHPGSVSGESQATEQSLQPRQPKAPKRLIDEVQDTPAPAARRPRIPHSVPYSHCINLYEDNTIPVGRLKRIQHLGEELGKLLYKRGMSQDDLRREWQLQVRNPADGSTYLRILIVLPDLTGQQPLSTTLEDVIREEGDEEEEEGEDE